MTNEVVQAFERLELAVRDLKAARVKWDAAKLEVSLGDELKVEELVTGDVRSGE